LSKLSAEEKSWRVNISDSSQLQNTTGHHIFEARTTRQKCSPPHFFTVE
jgi:hypothetical protein